VSSSWQKHHPTAQQLRETGFTKKNARDRDIEAEMLPPQQLRCVKRVAVSAGSFFLFLSFFLLNWHKTRSSCVPPFLSHALFTPRPLVQIPIRDTMPRIWQLNSPGWRKICYYAVVNFQKCSFVFCFFRGSVSVSVLCVCVSICHRRIGDGLVFRRTPNS
jgi:hypothetical protein